MSAIEGAEGAIQATQSSPQPASSAEIADAGVYQPFSDIMPPYSSREDPITIVNDLTARNPYAVTKTGRFLDNGQLMCPDQYHQRPLPDPKYFEVIRNHIPQPVRPQGMTNYSRVDKLLTAIHAHILAFKPG